MFKSAFLGRRLYVDVWEQYNALVPLQARYHLAAKPPLQMALHVRLIKLAIGVAPFPGF